MYNYITVLIGLKIRQSMETYNILDGPPCTKKNIGHTSFFKNITKQRKIPPLVKPASDRTSMSEKKRKKKSH